MEKKTLHKESIEQLIRNYEQQRQSDTLLIDQCRQVCALTDLLLSSYDHPWVDISPINYDTYQEEPLLLDAIRQKIKIVQTIVTQKKDPQSIEYVLLKLLQSTIQEYIQTTDIVK